MLRGLKKPLSRIRTQDVWTHKTMSLTSCPWEHEATEPTARDIHVLSYGGPKKMAVILEVFALLWKMGELSDAVLVKL